MRKFMKENGLVEVHETINNTDDNRNDNAYKRFQTNRCNNGNGWNNAGNTRK